MKAVWWVITSNGVPFLKIRSLGLHSKSGREKDRKKERTALKRYKNENVYGNGSTNTNISKENTINRK